MPAIGEGVGALVQNLRLEVATAAVLLALTTVLVEQPPARVAIDLPVDQVVRVEEVAMQVTVTPARVEEAGGGSSAAGHLRPEASAVSLPRAIQ